MSKFKFSGKNLEYPTTIRICDTTIPTSFHKKLLLEILCLNMSMAEIDPTVPPRKVSINKLNSEILLLCLVAFHLSNEKTMKVMRLMTKRKYSISQI